MKYHPRAYQDREKIAHSVSCISPLESTTCGILSLIDMLLDSNFKLQTTSC